LASVHDETHAEVRTAMRIQARWFASGLVAGILASMVAVAIAPGLDRPAPSPGAITAESAPSPTVALRRSEPADPTGTPPFLPTPSPSRVLPGQPPVTTDLRAQLECDQAYWHGQEVPDHAFEDVACSRSPIDLPSMS
jgi:hypothetical protein